MSKLIITETHVFRIPKLILGLSVIITYGTHSGAPVLNQPGSPQCTCSLFPVETPVQKIHGHQIHTYKHIPIPIHIPIHMHTHIHGTNALYKCMVHGTWYWYMYMYMYSRCTCICICICVCICICICVHHAHRHTYILYIQKMTPVKGW